MMTKIYRITPLAALMALLLAAGCTKERPTLEEPSGPSSVTPSYGTTYMSLSLRTGGGTGDAEDSNTESAPNYKQDWVGDDDFTTFAVYVISDNRNDVHYIGGNITTSNPDVKEFNNGKLTLTPWKTSPGKKTIYAFLNPPDQYVTYLGETLSNKNDFLERIVKPIPFQGEQGVTYSTTPEMYAFRPDPNIAKKVLAQPTKEVDGVHSFVRDPNKLYQNEDTPLSLFLQNVKPGVKVPPFLNYRDHMMCSGLSKGNNVDPDVTEAQVKNSRTNLFTMSVRRVLAQAVVTADNSILNTGIQGDPEKSQMRLRGLYFQVLNFEPTFYPIAETTDGNWYNNKNTKTPSRKLEPDNLIHDDFINFSTYETNVRDYPDFSAGTLISDNYFRSALFPKKEEIMESNQLKIPELLRRLELLVGQGVGKGFEGSTVSDFTYDKSYPTTLWGSCYLTETTHKWGKGTDSEYRKGNTPFFAVIAAFDIASLPWSSATSDGIASDIAKRQLLYEQKVAPLKADIAKKKQQLETVLETLKPLQEEVKKLEDEWVALVTPYLNNQKPRIDRLNKILKYREQYKNGEINSKKFESRVASDLNTISRYISNDKTNEQRKKAEAKWAELREADKKVDANEHKKEAGQINKEIKDLEQKVKDEYNRLLGKKNWFKDNYTQKLYELGANRIYYSLDEQKFYLDYHVIPVQYRGGGHNLQMGAAWLTPLIEERNKAIRKGAKSTDLPEPTQELLDLLSSVLNGTKQAETLTQEQQNAMNYYLYGRVTPELATYFGAANEYEPVDLHLGYVTWYTAKKENKDKVVNYEVLIRQREEGHVKDGRLLMVYYAWVNPSTNNRATWYSSPVLRNNIYHMHITGFTRMGLSGIPFVKKPTDPRFTYLHNIDPDEKVPSNDEYLPMTDTQMSVQVTNVGWGIHSYKKQF